MLFRSPKFVSNCPGPWLPLFSVPGHCHVALLRGNSPKMETGVDPLMKSLSKKTQKWAWERNLRAEMDL